MDVIAILLIVGWLLGVLSTYTFGGVIHVLLALAVGLIVLRQGLQRPPK